MRAAALPALVALACALLSLFSSSSTAPLAPLDVDSSNNSTADSFVMATSVSASAIRAVRSVAGQHVWKTLDPFLFCVHHNDHYPAAASPTSMGVPTRLLKGRELGSDFSGKDGFSMYHGDAESENSIIPGFPAHPHFGFETVTIARDGLIDHHDSLKSTGRFGNGDCQWMTAGKGVQHAEMFPLINDAPKTNHAEIFQIWINLPAKSKRVEPHYKMLWSEKVPVVPIANGAGTLTIYAGAFNGVAPIAPPPDSWASNASADVAIWTMRLASGAAFELPPASGGQAINRALYFFVGKQLSVGATLVTSTPSMVELDASQAVEIRAIDGDAELLMLQGRPIGEPVAQHGPFVANSYDEINQVAREFSRTRFGGWPWPSFGPVNPKSEGRFARHADGREERPSEV